MQYGRSQQQVLNLVVINFQTDSDNDSLTNYEERFYVQYLLYLIQMGW